MQAVASLVALLHVPAAHFVQLAAAMSPGLAPHVPTGQLSHCALLVNPAADAHVPSGHGFNVPSDWPARQKCPAGHRLEQVAFDDAPVLLLHLPAGQFVGAAELTGQKAPAGQVPVIHP